MKNQTNNSPAFLRALAEIANEPDGEVTAKKPKTKAEALARMLWDTALGKVREGRGPLNVPVKVRDRGDFKAAVALVKQLLDCPDSAARDETSHPSNQPPASNRESEKQAGQRVPNDPEPIEKPIITFAEHIYRDALAFIPGKDGSTRKKARDALCDVSREIVAGSPEDARIPETVRIGRKRAKRLYIQWVQANCPEVTEAEAAAEFDSGSDTSTAGETWEWLVAEPMKHEPTWKYKEGEDCGCFHADSSLLVKGLRRYGLTSNEYMTDLGTVVIETQ